MRQYTLHTALSSDLQRLYDEVEAFEKPTIAAVNGFALGGGCELAMSCDIRIAADTARFGLPETNLSVLPAAGGTQRLARLVGTGRAIEMILTGRLVDAAEAERIGLVTSVVPGSELLSKAREVADQIRAKGPLAVRLAKLVIRPGWTPTSAPAWSSNVSPRRCSTPPTTRPRAPTRSWPSAVPSSRGNDHVRDQPEPPSSGASIGSGTS